MKFQFLGTAAAEGVPALLCNCETCKRSRAVGGRAIRTRSQAIIDDTLLIDFPCDTLVHFQQNSLDMMKVTDCIITHNHSDHLYATDIDMFKPGFANVKGEYHITFHGSDKVGEEIEPHLPKLREMGRADFHELKAYGIYKIGKYDVTPMPGLHAPTTGPLIYIISDGDKTVLYAHDTNYFPDEVWEFLARFKPRFDLVSLDCTEANSVMCYVGHMSLAENALIRERFLLEGYADSETLFISNHFSHNGKDASYDDFVPLAQEKGFTVSYDGRVVML